MAKVAANGLYKSTRGSGGSTSVSMCEYLTAIDIARWAHMRRFPSVCPSVCLSVCDKYQTR